MYMVGMSRSISVLTMCVTFSLVLMLLMIGVPINVEGEDEALPPGWHEGVISDQLMFFGSCDGAVDSSGREQAVFWDGISPCIQYGISEGGGFQISTVNDPKPGYFDFSDTRMVLDNEDRPHIVYYLNDHFTDERLMYATKSGGVWTDSIVAQTSIQNYNDRFDFAVDAEGKVHIVYGMGSGIYYVNNSGWALGRNRKLDQCSQWSILW